MKKPLLLVLLTLFVFVSVSDAKHRRPRPKPSGTVSIPCSATIKKIEDCDAQFPAGCSNEREFDPNLNKRKNIRSSNQPVEDWDFSRVAALDDPVQGFAEGDTREKLADLGEGTKIRIVAFAVDVRRGSKESCNCGLRKVRDTDNHIVLIDPADGSPSLADEKKSLTAEFTPRVRINHHPNLSRRKLRPLILKASHKALKVRVTGLLMFDSFHSLNAPLAKGRKNNWEVHPVLKLEYCPKFKHCEAGSNANWKNLEH